MKPLASDRAFLILLAAVLAVALLLVISIATPFGLSAYLANVIGQLAAFAVLALSLVDHGRPDVRVDFGDGSPA